MLELSPAHHAPIRTAFNVPTMSALSVPLTIALTVLINVNLFAGMVLFSLNKLVMMVTPITEMVVVHIVLLRLTLTVQFLQEAIVRYAGLFP